MKYRFFYHNLYTTDNYVIDLAVPFDSAPYFKIFDHDGNPAAGFFTFEKCLEWLDERGEI